MTYLVEVIKDSRIIEAKVFYNLTEAKDYATSNTWENPCSWSVARITFTDEHGNEWILAQEG